MAEHPQRRTYRTLGEDMERGVCLIANGHDTWDGLVEIFGPKRTADVLNFLQRDGRIKPTSVRLDANIRFVVC